MTEQDPLANAIGKTLRSWWQDDQGVTLVFDDEAIRLPSYEQGYRHGWAEAVSSPTLSADEAPADSAPSGPGTP